MSLDSLLAAARKSKVKTALAIHRDIVELTPIDTGAATINWIVSAGEPSDKTVAVAKGYAMTKGSANDFAIGRAEKAVKEDEEGPVFIQNNLPYIVRLEEGHSKQAPGGMVKVALAAAKARSEL